MKKYIILVMACILLLAGCEMEHDSDIIWVESVTKEYVTAKEFMEYYSITEEQVPAYYVQAYIYEWRITSERMKRDERPKEDLLTDYENGVIYGYNIESIFRGKASNESLSEYMKQAEVIMFQFDRLHGEFNYTEIMVIDLREGKVYFAKCGDKKPEIDKGTLDDYINFGRVAELSDEDVTAIRKEIPEHIAEDKNIKDSKEYDYSISIQMRAADWTTKYFQDYGNKKVYFPGIDEYWKGLYKKYFGEEYEFTP